MPSTILRTDRYEFSMLESAIDAGVVDTPVVFEAFCRKLPPGRSYGVVSGIERILEDIRRFNAGPRELSYLTDILKPSTLDWLRNRAPMTFSGDLMAFRDGEVYFPYHPVVTVSGTFGECVLLETLILSTLNFDCAVASAASRIYSAARGKTLMDMGSRRVNPDAGVAAARAAVVGGFGSTSNLEAGYIYNLPTKGTAAHAWVMLFESEKDAFKAQVASQALTTLLVDTYQTEQGIRNAIEAAGDRLFAIRIDSGDLALEAKRARSLLDQAGCTKTRIMVSSDLDEYVIKELLDKGAPIDGFGVGTCVATGSGYPTAGFVYKMVERDGLPVEKKSAHKVSVGGKKWSYRLFDDNGKMTADTTRMDRAPRQTAGERPLQVSMIRNGVVEVDFPALAARKYHLRVREELRPDQLEV